MAPDLNAALSFTDSGLEASLEKFIELLTIRSVSGTPADSEGIQRCAEWLRHELEELGVASRVVQTAGHPVVLGHSRTSRTAPTVLLYGHYDVQPSAPDDAWTSPAFAPSIREENGVRRIFARGASDSKGQFWSMLAAIRAWRASGAGPPVNIIVLLEGEEENGSPSLPDFIDAHHEELRCDAAIVTDSDMWSPARPAITTRLKGLVHEKVTINAPNGDLHSGHFGNVAINPVRILSGILDRLHKPDGTVAIDGFYEGVSDLPRALRAQWNELDLGEALGEVSIAGGPREGGHTPIELMWGRPSIDINGIFGGNTGPAERSVLPGSASARLSFRLVDKQQPEPLRELFRQWVRGQVPDGCTVEFEGEYGTAAVSIDESSPYVKATAQALDAEWPQSTLIKGTGGTIPLVGLLADKLSVDCIVTGFILADDAIHAPNEHFDVERLHKATRSWVRVLHEIARANNRAD